MEKPSKDYIKTLRERGKTSHVHVAHQLAGLTIAELLRDQKHTSLYMKLAKQYDSNELMRLAKDVAERAGVHNRGAYFMRMMKINPPYKNKYN